MRTLLIGLFVGGLCGFALQRYVFAPEAGSRHRQRRAETGEAPDAPDRRAGAADSGELDRLRARIAELEAALAAGPGAGVVEDLTGGVEVPETTEAIEEMLVEFERTGDLDRLLALIQGLLRQGEKAYPRLTRVLMRVAAKLATGGFREEEALQRVVPAFKIALHHEKELVGYVGYLLTSDDVPALMRTPAMAIAMFLAINRVPGSEAFGPKLLEQFLAAGGGGGVLSGGGEQERMLVDAMGFLQMREAVDPLLATLQDPAKKNLHRRAIEALGRIGDERAVTALVQRLGSQAGGNDWWSGRAEVQALARIGTEQAIRAAEAHLASLTSDDALFAQAGGFLQVRPSDRVVGLIRDRFRNRPGANNLWTAVYALGRTGTPAALQTLGEIARDATNNGVRQTAQRMLDERSKLAEEAAALER